MKSTRFVFGAFLAATLGLLATPSARAAQLQQVTNWSGGTSFPSDVSMYAYVPDNVATNPPLLLVVHYCGGTASAVFGQAQGGGIVKAADQYGFIMVLPSSGRCWDVTSAKTQTRDSGADTHAIRQMVRFALDKYKANPDRVYSTGDSSGGMMTQLLMAVYPEVFKAGSAFAGVPAGCGNEFDGSGLCGRSAQTAQQWGDRVRAMYPGYTGHRPRIQLFHGDNDTTITYKNQAEAIKEWTNVLGLATTPTSTATGLTLGTHQAKRESWKSSCGFVVLDALTSIGGDHGPSDALFASQYVIPFLGLDKTGAVDPEIEQCGGSGTGGSSGNDGGAGTGGVGGGGGARTGGAGGGSGTGGTGGTSGSAGSTGSGGRGGSGGNGGGAGSNGGAGSGGRAGSGGGAGSSGGAGSGGRAGSGGGAGGSGGAGGTANNGGTQGSGGSQSSSGGAGGTSATSSAQASGGSGGSSSSSGGAGSSGSSSSQGGATGGSTVNNDPGSSGCSCALGGTNPNRRSALVVLALGLALGPLARRRRAASKRS